MWHARLREFAASDDLDHDRRRDRMRQLLACESATRLSGVLRLAQSSLPISDNGRDWDATPGLLGVPNGVVDLRTGELRDGRPEDRITMCSGAEFDPDTACPRWERFVAEIFGDDEHLVRYVQRLAGYSLTGEATLDLAAFLMGVGSNGKTTLLSTLRAAAGDYGREISAVALSSETRAAHSTEVTDLAGSRLASCEEMGDRRVNHDRLKAITGGGTVRARRMHENTIVFPVTWVLWITTNGLPRTDDNSVAFWRRVRVLPFEERFNPAAEPDLETTLRAELPGILRWMVQGAIDFYADEGREGPIPEAVREATAHYREDVDPLETLFESGVLVEDPDAETLTSVLFVAYTQWAHATNVPLDRRFGQDGFARRLGARFARCRPVIDGKKLRGFRGVRVNRDQVDHE